MYSITHFYIDRFAVYKTNQFTVHETNHYTKNIIPKLNGPFLLLEYIFIHTVLYIISQCPKYHRYQRWPTSYSHFMQHGKYGARNNVLSNYIYIKQNILGLPT
jgi:hypothetical protein